MNPPANWYPDPTGRHGQRYWDGSQWTEHVFTDGIQDVDPLDLVASEESDAVAEAALLLEETDGPEREDEEEAVEDGDPDLGAGVSDDSSTATPVARGWAEHDEVDEVDDGSAEGDRTSTRNEDVTGSGLFADAATSASDRGHAPDGAAWRPDDGPGDDADVTPEIEPGDVVAAVDEMADARGEADFSDAFILAPETASRLVGSSEPVPEVAPDDTGPDDTGPDHTGPDDTGADDTRAEVGPPPIVEDRVAVPLGEQTPDVRDTPPPSQPAPLTAASLGVSGDLVSGAFAEQETTAAVALQNSRLLRCAAAGGIIARQGTMVAYQGEVDFERQGAGGVGRALKRAATGEGLAMMRVTGAGDVFFADGGQHVFLLQLEGGPGLSVNGRNVLAFSSSLQWDIERVKGASLLAGGLFNTTLRGSGWVALVSDGQPVVLRTDEAPTYVDVNALVAWSGGLDTRIVNTVGAKSLVGLGSGEAFQMAFEGAGVVVVQPSEGPSAVGG